MQIKVIKTRDVLTPSLARNLARVQNPGRALEAMGLVCVSLAQRAFTDSSARPLSWAPLAPATVKEKARLGFGSAILVREGLLARSPRVIAVTAKNVTVGSDSPYGRYHQTGGGGLPARPFFPFDPSTGLPSSKARNLMIIAAKRTLGVKK